MDKKSCNNGNIVGSSVRVESNSYTSLLSVTVTPEVTGKSVICAYDNNGIEVFVGNFSIYAFTGNIRISIFFVCMYS